MFDFLVRNSAVSSAQNFIDKLKPKVQVNIHPEAPLPSIGLVKKLAVRAAAICALEPSISALSDEQLKAKTPQFKATIEKAIAHAEKNPTVPVAIVFKTVSASCLASSYNSSGVK